MLGNSTKFPERLIRLRPARKPYFDRLHDAVQRREVTIVQSKPTSQFPDPFNRIQIRTVRRQVTHPKIGLLLGPPLGVKLGVVILGVIRDHHHLATGPAATLAQLTKKAPGGHGIKAGGFAREEKLSIAQTDGTEVTDALARGMVKDHRVIHLVSNPHAGAGAVLLKMNFIDCPQINALIPCQGAEFFLCAAWACGSA